MSESDGTFDLRSIPVERSDEASAAWIAQFAVATAPAGTPTSTRTGEGALTRIFLALPPYLAVGDAVAFAFPKDVMNRSVAYSTDLTFEGRAEEGETMVSHAKVIGFRRQRVGSAVLFAAETHSERTGTLLSGARIALRLRSDCPKGEEFGETIDAPRVELPTTADVVAVELPTTAEHAAAFARAAREPSASIHTDADLARAVGLPGPILQGMCMLTMAGRELTMQLAGPAGAALSRITARYLASATPGETLTVRVRPHAMPAESVGEFVVSNAGGALIDGRIALRQC